MENKWWYKFIVDTTWYIYILYIIYIYQSIYYSQWVYLTKWSWGTSPRILGWTGAVWDYELWQWLFPGVVVLYGKQGLVNVLIEHHPTIGDIITNKYLKVMFKIPKTGHLPTPGKHKDNPNPKHHNKNSDMTNPAAKKTLRDPHAILVGGWAYPSEKSEFVSWDDYSPIYGKIIQMFQTTNQNMVIFGLRAGYCAKRQNLDLLEGFQGTFCIRLLGTWPMHEFMEILGTSDWNHFRQNHCQS